MKRSLILVVALALCIGGAATLKAERSVPTEKAEYMAAHPEVANTGPSTRALDAPVEAARVKNSRAMGTIVYDDGIVSALPGISSFCYGNQFDTFSGANPVMASGSVTAMSFFIVSGAGTDNVFVSVFGPVSGTAASVLSSASIPLNNGSNAFNTHVFASPVNYPGSSFLAGIWYVAGDTVGLGAGTVNGQGHHGMWINDIAGTGFATLSGLNALVGASGDVLPVELMTFTVQ
jgi:hypothetical protein